VPSRPAAKFRRGRVENSDSVLRASGWQLSMDHGDSAGEVSRWRNRRSA
jgi:hypothetical protein